MQQDKKKQELSLSLLSIALISALSFSSTAIAADSDGDGLEDSIERMYAWNPYNAISPGKTDSDLDGLTDLTEVKAFTNPYDANDPVLNGASDDDHDNLPKGLEVFLLGTNPDKADTDCDGENDDVDPNPLDGSCAPDPGADMSDDITINGNPDDDQVFSIGIPINLIYTVDYSDGSSISTSTLPDDASYMTWSISAIDNANLVNVSLNETTGQLVFNEGVDKGDSFTVKASVKEYPDVFDEIIVIAGGGVPNGESEITIKDDSSDNQSFPKGDPIQLIYTVDYTDGNPISTDGVDDSDFMQWSVSPEENLTLNKDTGILVFGDEFPVGTSVVVTAALKDNLDITDTIEIFADDALPRVLKIQSVKQAEEPSTDGRFTLTVTPAFNVDTTVNFDIGGSATNGVDYTTIPTSLTFPANTTTKAIYVDVKDDQNVESTETVILTLLTSDVYELSNYKTATVNIKDQIYIVPMTVSVQCNVSGGFFAPINTQLWTRVTNNTSQTGWINTQAGWKSVPPYSVEYQVNYQHKTNAGGSVVERFTDANGKSFSFPPDEQRCRWEPGHDANGKWADSYAGYNQRP
ncbi:Calx-beta domain-containing protein [Vibrio navarrensis]|uniref:Calx-beta domain-containing protein n=1 Tax=Vibrio navarrensis TaxID=29495 RepID=UPI001D057AC6|nr:Calx-beta domain-containing protein [Vibrio navarrensis]MBE3651677.1 hypothetical protein [Vibrio navarrensis]